MSGYSYDAFDADAECLYHHFQTLKKAEPPAALVKRFRQLFIIGSGYPQPEIQAVLYRLVASRWAVAQFPLILNRCFYILINHWWQLPSGREAAADLVLLVHELPELRSDSNVLRRLHALMQQFRQSKEYAALQRWVWAAKEPPKTHQDAARRPIGELINRYPMLYPHYLLEYNSSEWGHQVVKQRQAEREQQFEESLLQYTRFKQRRSNSAALGTRTPAPVTNPTLLSDRELEAAIRQFAGKAADARTYRDAARLLVVRANQAQTYEAFKRQLYDELTGFVREAFRLQHPNSQPDFDYGRQRFNDWLDEQLKKMLPERDGLPPNPSLRVQTCARLLDLLLDVPREGSLHHVIFIDLTSNLGATLTVGLLLKIVLLCYDEKRNLDAIKSHLAKRFAKLFKHYELKVSLQDSVSWLVNCLENWMVAASVQFGKSDSSWWATLLSSGS